jgi:hypothetical protein
MDAIAPAHMLLASTAGADQVSLNFAAWAGLARNGLVETRPLFDDRAPAFVVTLTENGKAALAATAILDG